MAYDIMLPAVLAVFHCFRWYYIFRYGSERVKLARRIMILIAYRCWEKHPGMKNIKHVFIEK